ncbi:MAG TPA: hypothetical protein VGC59_03065 [Solirubrobacteraceae bacterium]
MQAVVDMRNQNPFASKRSRVLALIVALAAMAIVPAVMPATSEASACGYEYWGATVFRDIPIAKGQLTHCINGSGQHVNWDGANFASAGNLCDSSMKFTYGYGRQSISGNVHWGCSHVGQWKYAINSDEPRGQACAELWVYNWQKMVARQCHFVG